ncbi:glycosyltransferase family 2 protein [Spirosoma fluviale]|uniref:Glycosyltransferase, GT2 family n=1 Tax=Spirosoma fluviale TaxID=1597977 RepID=A0A286F834_9BACT|nr:glycosyltransferase [Spirosoma fluviale]SOD79353.1 Glycosyltransferase, GT2 family [Spirosoma fluviale]
MEKTLVTVIIPTYKRPALLRNCLIALTQQTLSKETFEVVVVDDGNESAVAELVQEVAKQTGLKARYLGQQKRQGPAAARNAGWRSARTPFIAFTDDDCLPQPAWLSTALVQFIRGAQVLTGRVTMPMPEQPSHHDKTTALLETAEFVTANLFCRKTVLEQVGGFDERFDIAWREDSDLHFKIIKAGIPILPCPDAVIVHPIRSAPWYAPLRDERKNRYDALLFKEHPVLFRERIPAYKWLVIRYYVSVASLLVGLIGLLIGNSQVVGLGFSLWLLLTLALINERLDNQPITGTTLKAALITSLVTPFLSVYWRLYGAFSYRVWYW